MRLGRPREKKYLSWGAKLPENKWCELATETLTTCEQEQDQFTNSFELHRCLQEQKMDSATVSPFPALGCVGRLIFRVGAIPWEQVNGSEDGAKVDFTSFELSVWSIWAEGVNEVLQWPTCLGLLQSHAGRRSEAIFCNCLAEAPDTLSCREGMIQATKGYRAS